MGLEWFCSDFVGYGSKVHHIMVFRENNTARTDCGVDVTRYFLREEFGGYCAVDVSAEPDLRCKKCSKEFWD